MKNFIIKISGFDRQGAVNDIISYLGKEQLMIDSVDFRADGFRFEGKIVAHSYHDYLPSHLFSNLKAIRSVKTVLLN